MIYTLGIRTDTATTQLILADSISGKLLELLEWQSGRDLSEQIHQRIDVMLQKQTITMGSIGGIIVYEGPGSFTGLRIGMSVANALAYAYAIPVVTSGDESWLQYGMSLLKKGEDFKIVTPLYGSEAKITLPKNN